MVNGVGDNHSTNFDHFQPLFVGWLDAVQVLQVEGYGARPHMYEGPEFADFVMFNAVAAIVEIAELLNELPWKPWSKKRGRPAQGGRDQAVVEWIDAMHFMGNLGLALRVTKGELNEKYAAKSEVNLQRQRERYGGRVPMQDDPIVPFLKELRATVAMLDGSGDDVNRQLKNKLLDDLAVEIVRRDA